MSGGRVDLDGNQIKPITICMIGAGGFIGSHLCEKLIADTPHKVLAVDVYNDKIKHLLEPSTLPWADRIQFHRLNIKNDSRLEGLIRMSDLVIFFPLLLLVSAFWFIFVLDCGYWLWIWIFWSFDVSFTCTSVKVFEISQVNNECWHLLLPYSFSWFGLHVDLGWKFWISLDLNSVFYIID